MRPSLAVLLLLLRAAAGKIYFTDGDQIQRCNYDGSALEAVVTGLSTVDGVAVSPKHGLLFWADPGTQKVSRSNLDGSELADVVTSGLELPFGVAVDEDNDMLYWTDAGTDVVERATLEGDARETVLSGTGDGLYWSTHVQVLDGWMYWSDTGSGNVETYVRRQRVDGGEDSRETVVTRSDYSSNDRHNIYGFYVADDVLYFESTKFESGYSAVLERVFVNGTGLDNIYVALPGSYGVAADARTGDLFWVSYETAQVFRGSIDGEADPVAVYSMDADRINGDVRPWGMSIFAEEDRCGGVFCIATPAM